MNTNLAEIIPDGEVAESWLLDRARLTVYQFLALAASDPRAERWSRILDPDFQELVRAAVEVMRQDPLARPDVLAPGEIATDALDPAPLISFIPDSQDELIAEYDRIFSLVVSKECPPYETEYCAQTFSVYRSQQLADIAGYYRAFGLEPSRKHPERHDHIVLELEFMAWLIAKTLYALEHGEEDNAGLCRDAQVSFFRDHFAWWTPMFAVALRRKADGISDKRGLTSTPKSYLGAVGTILAAFVPAERGILGISPSTAPRYDVESSSEGCEACSLSPYANPE